MEMTAIKKIKKLLGKEVLYRVNPKAPSADERAEAEAALPAAYKVRDEAKAKREARYQEVLKNDAEYQRLKAEAQEAQKRVSELASISRCFKFTVGFSVMGLMFSVQAEGDSWEQIIEKLQAKKAKGHAFI